MNDASHETNAGYHIASTSSPTASEISPPSTFLQRPTYFILSLFRLCFRMFLRDYFSRAIGNVINPHTFHQQDNIPSRQKVHM